MSNRCKERKPCSHGQLSIAKDHENPGGPLRNTGAGRASFSNFVCEGSMTIEAALVLPIFIFFMAEILSIYDMVRLQSSMIAALHETGSTISEYAFYAEYGLDELSEIGGDGAEGSMQTDGGDGSNVIQGSLGGKAASFAISETYVRGSVVKYLGEDWLNHTCLAWGSSGISYLESSVLNSNGVVEIVADYRIKPFLAMFGLKSLPAQSRYYGHAWTGYVLGDDTDTAADAEENEETVYVTPTGTVYHKDHNCTYLKPSIRTIDAGMLDTQRSGDGSKYYPCERCRPSAAGTVVITKEGNRYHSSASCTAIERNAESVPISEAQKTRRACSKCGGS